MANVLNGTESISTRDASECGRWLQERAAFLVVLRSRLRSTELRWAWARLLTFAIAAGGWIPVSSRPVAAIAVVAAGLVGFGVCVRRHRGKRASRELVDREVIVVDEARRRCGGRLEVIRSGGRPADADAVDAILPIVLSSGRTWSLTRQELDDLDVYSSPAGLFGLLNRCSTAIGARRLRDVVENCLLDGERIEARQEAVRWLDDHRGERIAMMAGVAGLRGRDVQVDELTAAIRKARAFPATIPIGLLRLWGTASLLVSIWGLGRSAVGETGWIGPLLGLLFVNGFVYYRLRAVLNATVNPWRQLGPAAEGVLIAAELAVGELPDEGELRALREQCGTVLESGVLPGLLRYLYWADTGGPVHAFLNAIFFYDLQVGQAILRRVIPHCDALLGCIAAVAELEALMGLACFADEQPVSCYPELARDGSLLVERGQHPLVAPEACVPNGIELNGERHVWVITGSNMAGKSTFLRMIGVNALLAQIGSAVCAELMTLSPLRLVTDLRARDDLAEHASYFMAEVRHIRRVVAGPDDPTAMLALIDEPFRGTNSIEQSAAGVALVRHLMRSRGLFVVATHDRAITRETEANFHFQENLGESGPVFDYRLREGPARTRNALEILAREGYPAALVDDARRLAAAGDGAT